MFCRFLDIVGTECGDQRKSMLGDSVPMGDGMRRQSARGATVGAEMGSVGRECGEAGGPMPMIEEWEVDGAGGIKWRFLAWCGEVGLRGRGGAIAQC